MGWRVTRTPWRVTRLLGVTTASVKTYYIWVTCVHVLAHSRCRKVWDLMLSGSNRKISVLFRNEMQRFEFVSAYVGNLFKTLITWGVEKKQSGVKCWIQR